MKTFPKFPRILVCGLALICLTASAALPSDWRHEQQFIPPAASLLKISLPVETLDAVRPGLEDLRLYDDTGNEVPFVIERPSRVVMASTGAKSFDVSLNPSSTVINLQTGLVQPIDGVSLMTPAKVFIKGVRVEGSLNGESWQPLVHGQPIFRQENGVDQLHVSIPPGVWLWLRLTVDDRRSTPIPFTGARIHPYAAEPTPGESQPAVISERTENPGETRLTMNLGAANLDITSVKIETEDPLFTRVVQFAVPVVDENSIREHVIGQGVIYRIAVEGEKASARLSAPLGLNVPSRELVLLIRNEDSPPLNITGVSVERRPVYLVFLAKQSGTFHLLTGNKFCPAPRYDLATLGASLTNATLVSMPISKPADNPNYHAPEALAGLEVSGAPLDISAWKFRKPVQITHGGGQQVELDLDILTHASPSFADLRFLRESNQVPYIIEHTSIDRALTPIVTVANDAKNPKLSRWIIKLPRAGLPLTRLTCTTTKTLFQRELSLYEERSDERGEKYRHELGSASWTQTPERKSKEETFALTGSPQSATLFLETDNGDNPAIELEKFTLSYPATRVLLKTAPDDKVFLYYGNPQALPPHYDLSLVAGGLLAADKSVAALGAEEQLKKNSWAESQPAGGGGVVFWGILALVVVGLLAVISRLLPKTAPPVN